jgi:hypothetical protein
VYIALFSILLNAFKGRSHDFNTSFNNLLKVFKRQVVQHMLCIAICDHMIYNQ